MITNRRRTKLLFKGCLLILSMEFAVLTSVLATAPATNSSRNSLPNKIQSGNQKQLFSNVTTPEKNASTNKVTNKKTTNQTTSTIHPPTAKAFTFLDDYGDLPGVSYDDDDDDDTLTSTTTTATTTAETLIHEKKEVNLLFKMANQHLEYNREGERVGEKKNKAVSTSLRFNAAPAPPAPKDVNIVAPVRRQRRSQDLPELVPNPAQLAIEQLLFTDGGSGEVTETTEVATATITTTSKETTTAPTTTATITTSIATTTAPTTTAIITTRTETTAAPTTTTTTSASTTRTPTTTTPRRTTTTHTPQRTTSPPILETKPPNIVPGDSERILYFLIVIIIPFTEDLFNQNSDMFILYSREIRIKVDLAYRGCPGYIPNSVVVTNFRRATSTLSYRKYFLALNSAIEPLQTTDTINSTIADYNVTFETATVYQQPDEIINYIKDTVTPLLESTTIANSSVMAPENQYLAHTQIKNITKAPCQDLTCDPCYECHEETYSTNSSGNDSYARAYCRYTCNLSKQRCTITDNTQAVWKGQCSCIAGYLPVGNSCTDERIIIGVSVAVASVLFLAFVIVVVILCCKAYRKKKKPEDSDSETSSVNSQTVDNRRRLIAEQGVPRNPALNQSTTENADGPSSQMASNVQPMRTSLPLIIFTDEDEGEDALPPEITQSEAFVNFVPNLDNVVDDSKVYTIPRPNLSTSSSYNSQGTNYDNSFFF